MAFLGRGRAFWPVAAVWLASAPCGTPLGGAAACWAGGWRVQVSGGVIQGAAYDGRPVLAAAADPLARVDVEFPVGWGDVAVALQRNWKVIAGPEDAASVGNWCAVARKPLTLEWTFTLKDPRRPRAWLLARHSEVSAQGLDLGDAYDVSIDENPLSGAWRRLAVRHFGNAWLGWLDLGETDLAAGEHRLRIATKKDWCFLDRFLLVSSGADPVRFDEELASSRVRVSRRPGGALEIARQAGPLEVVERIEWLGPKGAGTRRAQGPAGGALRLTGSVRWQSAPTVLRGITWQVPLALSGEGARVAFPGGLPPGELPLPRAPGRIYPRPRSPLAIFREGGHCLSVLAYSTASTADLATYATATGARLEAHFAAYGYLKPGARMDLGQVLIAPTAGDVFQAADAFADLYRTAGLRPPPQRPAWAQDLTLYCAHPGGPIERGFAQPGGFKEFAQRLPALARMGITGLWLLPIFEHGPEPYSIYAPVDQFTPARRLGTPDDFRGLVDAAHTNRIEVLLDFVPHGPPENSALAQLFADAISLDQDARRKTRWGWAFDYANPRWQKYMHDAAAHSARAFGIDGTRLDVFPGDSNWDPRVPYLASFPVLGGGLGMARAIRSGIAQVRGSAFAVPESYETDPAMWSVADAAYDAGLYFLLEDLARRGPPPDQWADTLSRWLELQRRALPPWALEMRFTANHDTVTSVFLKARPAAAFGYERSRALAAIITLSRGIPMIYQGEEDAALWGGKFPSSVEFYTRLFNLRRDLEALRRGSAEYRAVRASPGVWTCLRRGGASWALGVVSLWPQEREVWLTLPAGLRIGPGPPAPAAGMSFRGAAEESRNETPRIARSNRALVDAFSGAPLTCRGRSVRLRLPGYGVAVLTPAGRGPR